MRLDVFRTALIAFAIALAGCGVPSSHEDGPDAGDTDTGDPIPLTAVDLLVVVDTTIGSINEEPILAQGLFELVGALLHPLPGSTYDAVDDLRVAAITSSMGFSANGEDMDDYWPGTMSPECEGFGDNGLFQDISAPWVELQNDVIPCDESAHQCPPGWACAVEGDAGVEGIGVCHTDEGTEVECPTLAADWAETAGDPPSWDFALQAACLAMQGSTMGGDCGWMQPLQSAATALTRDNQVDFIRDFAVLAIVVSTNEDDCSLEDGPGMFAEEEVANPALMKMNIACGENPVHLFAPSDFYQRFVEARGRWDAVVFVGIVGVPYADQSGAAACQGYGDQLGDCWVQAEMQLVPEQPNAPDDLSWYYRPACTRNEGDVEVTDAWPARRFVELANSTFSSDSYIYSVCNADWSPAFDALSAMIAEKLTP